VLAALSGALALGVGARQKEYLRKKSKSSMKKLKQG